MNSFRLKIVTPNGVAFDGMAEELIVRTTTGDLGILAGHIPCVAPLGMGRATIITQGKRRYAACIGGMVSVMESHVNLVPTSFEWAEDIDQERAAASERRAREVLKDKTSTETDLRLAEARLKRALVRKSIVQE